MTQLVIGAGLLGHSLVESLLEAGERVRVLDLFPYLDSRVEVMVGDILNPGDLARACAGVDTVYHTAAMVSQSLGKVPAVYAVNVTGTQNVIAACRQQGVRHLVYTSSIDVVFDGTPIVNGDETLPYPARHLDYYGETKMLAEQVVIQASGVDGLRTVSLRTAGIYGPYDCHRFPPILRNARKGVFVQLGDGRAQFNHVYVKNVARAHLCAAENLHRPDSSAAGHAYFITDHAPANFFSFILPFMESANLAVRVQRIPSGVARGLANLNEWAYRVFPGTRTANAQLTRYVVEATCQDFWFSGERARQDLGYQPVVSEAEAHGLTVDWIVNHWIPTQDMSSFS
ncbi:MAG: NAD-dependent epimerase/dehydratase family protein [Anaerolineae bacterium]|nr:NAD-dependent epimerase/dehydratase family protein [Anaerolineae bacterium]